MGKQSLLEARRVWIVFEGSPNKGFHSPLCKRAQKTPHVSALCLLLIKFVRQLLGEHSETIWTCRAFGGGSLPIAETLLHMRTHVCVYISVHTLLNRVSIKGWDGTTSFICLAGWIQA